MLHVDPKTVRRAAERNDLPAIRPLANGPWIFSRSDLAATVLAERAVSRARVCGTDQGGGPSLNQLSLDIPST